MRAFCLPLLLAFLLVGLLQAANDRAALVVETRGQNTLTFQGEQANMRTLQVLPEGARISVPAKGGLRLSYFRGGTKENITGPCEVEIGTAFSKKITATGHVRKEQQRKGTTDLGPEQNLRRTGGALQASIAESPQGMVAQLDRADLYNNQVVGAVVRLSKAEFVGLSSTSLSPNDVRPLTWESNTKSLLLHIKTGSTELTFQPESNRFTLPPEILAPGQTLTATLKSGDRVLTRQELYILSDEEYEAYQARMDALNLDHRLRERYVEMLQVQLDAGLLHEAFQTSEKAIAEYPNDPGFLFQAARLQLELGNRERARKLAKRAFEVEQAVYRR